MQTTDPITLFDRLMAVKPVGLSRNAWAVRAGVNRNIFNDIKRRGAADRDTLEKLLEAIGLTEAQFEAGQKAEHHEPPPKALRAPVLAFRGKDRPRDVPIVGTAECAEMDFDGDAAAVTVETMEMDLDHVVDYARRPATLDNRREVYAIYFRGHSLSPRYEPGELAYVDPVRPPSMLDYVIIQLRRPDEHDGERTFVAMAKRLVRQSASFIELQQFDPPATFRVPRSEVKHMHRVIPWDELVVF